MTIGHTLIQNALKIGERLRASELISPHQLETALFEQRLYEMMRLGEILVLHGWVQQQTADFFGDQWPYPDAQADPVPIGSYLRRAGLIDRTMVDTILIAQKKTGLRFGAIAVLNGYIRQATLDFFVEQFYPEYIGYPPYMIVDPDSLTDLSAENFIQFDPIGEVSTTSDSNQTDGSRPSFTNEVNWLD